MACKKENTTTINGENGAEPVFTYTEHATSNRDVNNDQAMVLGSSRQIPYTLANMRAALAFINANTTLNLKTKIEATHYYVEFGPTTDEHLSLLDSLCNEFALYNYPIQYEIEREGSYLQTASQEENKFAPLYATIPSSASLPNVPYAILDSIFDPSDDELDLVVTSYVLTDNSDMLGIQMNGEDLDAVSIITYLNLPTQTKGNNTYYPEGVLRVYNTSTSSYSPVSNTKLNIVRFGIPHSVTTDAQGHFVLSKKMRGEVKVRATWRNGDYTIRKAWNEMIGIAVSDYVTYINKGNSGADNYINIDRSNSHLWYKATVSNALWKYNTHMSNCGVQRINDNANVWIIVTSDGKGGATPMLRKYPWSVSYNALFIKWLRWFAPVSYPTTSFFDIFFRNIYPDLVFSLSSSEMNTKNIDKLVFHEAGHFSHGMKSGSAFWGSFVRDECENIVCSSDHDPYRDGTKPSISLGKRIALCEGWANFVSYNCMKQYYNTNYSIAIDGFNMRTTPSYITDELNCWFLTGLYWDIIDNVADTQTKLINAQTGATINYITDNLQIGSYDWLSPIYSLLVSSTTNGTDLKNRLVASYPNKTTQINQLFSSYGY